MWRELTPVEDKKGWWDSDPVDEWWKFKKVAGVDNEIERNSLRAWSMRVIVGQAFNIPIIIWLFWFYK